MDNKTELISKVEPLKINKITDLIESWTLELILKGS